MTFAGVITRIGIAVALAVSGISRAYLYIHGYRHIPTIGTAFVAQASVSFAVAALILVGGPAWLRWAAAMLVGALAGETRFFLGNRGYTLTPVHTLCTEVSNKGVGRMIFRATLVAASITTAAISSASLASAGPGCTDGHCALAPVAHSPSYQDGYNSEHDFYSIPRNATFLKNEMQQGGYDTGMVCRLEMSGGPQPPNAADWMSGCIDALHDLGFKP